MPSYFGYDSQGNRFHMRGDLGPHCADCMDVAINLCDYPVGKNKTCDRHICNQHSNEVAPDIHYCRAHFEHWLAFEKSGGVKKVLENVTPFGKGRFKGK